MLNSTEGHRDIFVFNGGDTEGASDCEKNYIAPEERAEVKSRREPFVYTPSPEEIEENKAHQAKCRHLS